MKRIIAIISVFSFLSLLCQEHVLVTNNGEPFITVEEFKEKFDYTLNHDEEQSKNSILDYYITVKLKEIQAEKLGLKNSPEYLKEISNFVKEKDVYYLEQDSVYTMLRNQFQERFDVEFQLVQYFVSGIKPSKAVDYQNKFTKNTSFLEDKKNVKKLETQYLRVGELPYDLEQEVFKNITKGSILPVNDLGNENYVFTFIKDVRPYSGTYKFQLLLINDTLENGTKKIEELYKRATRGESFNDLKREFSEDENSKYKRLITLEGTTLDNKTLSILNELDKEEISKPFKTTFGWNLVKLIEHEVNRSKSAIEQQFNYAIGYNTILNEYKVRYVDEYLKPIQKKMDINQDFENKKLIALFKQDSITKEDYNEELTTIVKTEIEEKNIVVFNNGMTYTNWNFISDNALFLRNIYKSDLLNKQQLIENQLPLSIVQAKVLLFDKLQKEFNPQYKKELELVKATLLTTLYDEYQFNVALNDQKGLLQKYNEIKGNYTWDKRVEVLIAYCNKNQKLAEEIKKKFKKKVVIEKLQQQYAENNVYFRKIKREFSSKDLPKDYNKKSKVAIYKENGDFFVVKTVQILPSQNPTYEELQPIVEAKYKEEYLNKKIDQLKENIIINQNVLNNL